MVIGALWLGHKMPLLEAFMEEMQLRPRWLAKLERLGTGEMFDRLFA
jgi:hypothetical protein